MRPLEEGISKRKDPAPATVFRTENMDKLRALAFGISGSMEEGASMFARLKRRIGLERKMASTEAAVLGGSPTARRMPDPREGLNSTAAELAVQGGDLGLPPGFGIAMSKLSSGIGDEYRRAVDGQIARKALDSDPMALSALLRQLESLNSVPARVVEQYMGGPAGGSVVGQQVPGLLRDE